MLPRLGSKLVLATRMFSLRSVSLQDFDDVANSGTEFQNSTSPSTTKGRKERRQEVDHRRCNLWLSPCRSHIDSVPLLPRSFDVAFERKIENETCLVQLSIHYDLRWNPGAVRVT